MLAMSCGGHSNAPTQPTSRAAPGPAPVTVADVRVGTAGNASPSLSPGQTLQLFAQATSSDGTSADVTNLAVWQSSNPVVATVSPTGLVTAAVEGDARRHRNVLGKERVASRRRAEARMRRHALAREHGVRRAHLERHRRGHDDAEHLPMEGPQRCPLVVVPVRSQSERQRVVHLFGAGEQQHDRSR